MQNTRRDCLVVGGDGLIGTALTQALRAAGHAAVPTSRRPTMADAIALDLADWQRWTVPATIGSAVLCAGTTAFKACADDPQGTRRINVEATVGLARRLVERGIALTYLSSNAVFSGHRPFCRVDDAPDAGTEYGRQKVAAEAGLLALPGSVTILRLTKVVSPTVPLFLDWCTRLRRGEPVQAFADRRMAPLPLPQVTEILCGLVDRPLPGLQQLSGAADVSFAQFVQRLAIRLGADPSLVSAIDTGADLAQGNTTLAISPDLVQRNIRPASVEEAVACVVGTDRNS